MWEQLGMLCFAFYISLVRPAKPTCLAKLMLRETYTHLSRSLAMFPPHFAPQCTHRHKKCTRNLPGTQTQPQTHRHTDDNLSLTPHTQHIRAHASTPPSQKDSKCKGLVSRCRARRSIHLRPVADRGDDISSRRHGVAIHLQVEGGW